MANVFRLNEKIDYQIGYIPPEMPAALKSTLIQTGSKCDLLMQLFDGTYWERLRDDKKYPKWPLRINLFQTACFIHTATWAGDMPDTSEPVAKPHIEPQKGRGGASAAQQAAELIDRVWYENNSRPLLLGANTLAQVVGGVVIKLRWDPDGNWRQTLPIKVEVVSPKFFVGVADSSNHYDLSSAWIVKRIPLIEAEEQYGYKRTNKDSDEVQYVEHWTRYAYKITVNEQVARFRNRPMEGANQWGFVPMVYVPHIRIGNSFTGEPLFSQLIGLAEEYNGRMANEGDLFVRAVRAVPWMRNVREKLSLADIGGLQYLMLGSGTASGQPELKEQVSPSLGGNLTNYNERLERLMRILSFTPDVAWGEDQGSQRSGESRDRLLLPLSQHISMEREFWTPGLNVLGEMMLRMAGAAGIEKIGQRHYNHRMSQIWHPMYPADRAKLVDEMIARAQAFLVSPEHAIEMFGDVEDVKAEIALIKAFLDWKANIGPAKAVSLNTGDGQDNPGGGSNITRPDKDKMEGEDSDATVSGSTADSN